MILSVILLDLSILLMLRKFWLGWSYSVSSFNDLFHFSVLAVESKKTDDDTKWLVYWVVYSSFGFVEYFGHSFFHSLPFYWLLKCLFLFWLMTPGANGGSQMLYNRLIKPFVLKYQPLIDKHVQDGKKCTLWCRQSWPSILFLFSLVKDNFKK